MLAKEIALNDALPPAVIDTAALTSESQQQLGIARDYRITTVAQYDHAGVMLTGIASLKKKISETFSPHIARAFAAHKALVKESADAQAPLLTAEQTLKGERIRFRNAEEQKRLAAERVAQEAAEKAQAKLREQAAVVERAAAQKAADLRRQQEEAEAAGRAAEAAKLAARASAAETSGANKAAALQERAELVPTPVIESRITKTAGVSTSRHWRVKSVDIAKLIPAVAAGTVPQAALEANMKFLGEQARSLKSALLWPGVEVEEVESERVRG